jgi:antitoxin HigA-1
LKDLGLTITSAAKVLGVSRTALSKLINGSASMSPDMAIRISKAFGSTPEFWLRLQHNYDLAQVKKLVDKIQVERYQPKEMPAEMDIEESESLFPTN